MATATERDGRAEAGRPVTAGGEEMLLPPAQLLDLLQSSAMDAAGWRLALVGTCVDGLSAAFGREGEGPPARAFWLHAGATASAAARLADAIGTTDSQIAFAAGLLHDIGKLALAVRFPRSYVRAIELALERHEPITIAEAGLFGVDHTQAGRRLAEQWCLPRSLVDAIWLHHQPAESLPERATRELVVIVSLADALVGEGWPGWGIADPAGPGEPAGALGVDAATLQGIETQLAGDVASLIGETEDCSVAAKVDAGAERALASLVALAKSMRSGMSVAELCAVAADAAAETLGIAGACLIASGDGSDLLDIGAATPGGPLWDRLPMLSDGSPLSEIALLRVCGARVLPAPPQCAAILERFCGPAHGLGSWATAMYAGERLVGALLFRATVGRVRTLMLDGSPFGAMITILPALIGQAELAAMNARRGEELAIGARRLGDSRNEAAAQRSAAAMAEFASGAAHELNTPLAVVAGRADQLLSWELDPELHRAVSAIREHSRRCAEIVGELAAFADPTPAQAAMFDVGPLLAAACDGAISASEIGATECCVEISDDLPPIVADEAHVRVMVRELLSNAIEATAGRERRLTIKAARHRTDEQIVISVADNGRGMTPAIRERAFDPFFSQRPAGRGRGLGLSRVRRLAALNGGHVRLASEADRGTVVEVSLPAGNISG